MTFLTISENWQGVLIAWVGTLQLLLFYNFMCYVQIGRGKSRLRCILVGALNFILFEILDHHIMLQRGFSVTLPLWCLILVIIVLTVLGIAEQYRIIKWKKGHITAMSIRNALDALPTGLCYATPEGLPFLVNEKMEELISRILGIAFQNTKEVWEKLERGEGKGALRTGTECIYRLPDGKVYGFHREELTLDEGIVWLIRAVDITQEYSMTEELAEKQKKAKTLNTRLKSLMDTIEYVTMSRELLNLKVALHDNLGRSLLAARRFIVNPEAVEPRKLLDIWQMNMQHLIGEAPEEWQVPYYIAKKEAGTLGIDLQIVGTLPVEEALLPVIDQAISTHMINVLRHADGKTAMVYIEEGEKEYRISFKNDGKQPTGEIHMTGGLGNLKRTVEEAGGQMEVYSSPQFEMVLTLPKGEKKGEVTYAIWSSHCGRF